MTSWLVKDGKQEEFVERWTTFLNWTRETRDGLSAAQLVADEDDRQRYETKVTI